VTKKHAIFQQRTHHTVLEKSCYILFSEALKQKKTHVALSCHPISKVLDALSPIAMEEQRPWKRRHSLICFWKFDCMSSAWESLWKQKCGMQLVLGKSLTGAEVDALGKADQWAVTCELRHLSTCFLLCDCLSSFLEADLWSLTKHYINATLC
jgi:hypothetical protein